MLQTAIAMHAEDVENNRRLSRYGAELIDDGDTILTHCNAGALATGGYGTALGVIRAASEAGKELHVFATETRPYFQGARLTVWELKEQGIDVTLVPDNHAGLLCRAGHSRQGHRRGGPGRAERRCGEQGGHLHDRPCRP